MNHFYDAEADRTRCGDMTGDIARECSANDRVSCSDCIALMSPAELADQFHGNPTPPHMHISANRGTDAGTGLRTMLARLKHRTTPPTDHAAAPTSERGA